MLAKQRFKGSTGRCGLGALSRPRLNPVVVVVLVLVLVLVVGRVLLMCASTWNASPVWSA